MNIFTKLINWFSTPITPNVDRKNFQNVEVDAVGIGLANAASPFLPVFLTKLGASNIQVGLLTSMPAVTGFLLAIPLGNFLQGRKNIVPWFSRARLLVVTAYALTGVVTLFAPPSVSVLSVLLIWALATLPQTVVAIGFSVVMNAVAGPSGRFELMSHRWSILGFTTAVTVILAGQVLNVIPYPRNYQMVFIALSVGGLLSFYFSNHIRIPDSEPPSPAAGRTMKERVGDYFSQIRSEKAFTSFVAKRFVFMTGVGLSAPLFPLYFVRVIDASEAWIGIISTAQTAILIIGYFFWLQQSRRRGSQRVLIMTTFGTSIYPILVALTHRVEIIAVLAGFSGIFQAGLDLVFFDELLKTIPPKSSAVFVAFAQSLLFLSNIVSPLVGALLADSIGLSGALMVSAGMRILGALLFALGGRNKIETVAQSA